MRKSTSTIHKAGFTIVELLIVIVVIAILATISIVAYNGIQQRANNTAIINAASNTLKLIQAYTVQEDTYPLVRSIPGHLNACITNESGCVISAGGSTAAGNDALNTALAQVGQAPQSVPMIGDGLNGLVYQYNTARNVGGRSQPLVLIYWLQGTNQNCGVPGVVTGSAAASQEFSTTGYTNGNISGKTRCEVSVPGPEHL